MSRLLHSLSTVTFVCLLCAQSLAAQDGPVSFDFDGGVALQSSTDLSDVEGSFSVNRWFASMGVNYAFDKRNQIGLSVGGGSASYDFDDLTDLGDGVPWEDVDNTRISLNGRFRMGETGTLFVVTTARYYGEDNADTSDGRTYGVFVAGAWRLKENLTIGPGISVFSKLEDGTRVFPVLVIDWQINERWFLSTRRGVSSSQGPGATLGYKASEEWTFGLSGRKENIEFRLDDDGPAPGGIGKNKSLPVVASVAWEPNNSVQLALFAGFEFAGQLKLKDAQDELVSETDYDPAPVYGAAFELRF